MKKNQYGFSAVEASLILVIVGIIGGTGWYVMRANKNTTDTLINSGLGAAAKTSKKKLTSPSVEQSADPAKGVVAQINGLLNKGEYLQLDTYMADKVSITIQSTDGNADFPKVDAAKRIDNYLTKSAASLGAKLPWDFKGHSDIREKISKSECCITSFKEQNHIGISQDNLIVAYNLNSNSRIESFYISGSADYIK
jgi:hypothetical protein